jgi:hypothetical protein
VTYWQPGTQIHWIYTGRTPGVDNVRPMTVVRDDADGLAGGRDVREAGLERMFLEPRVPALSSWHVAAGRSMSRGRLGQYQPLALECDQAPQGEPCRSSM